MASRFPSQQQQPTADPANAGAAAAPSLSTPLVPHRQLSASTTGAALEPTPSLFNERPSDPISDLFGQAAPPPVQTVTDLFGQAVPQPSTDPFGSPSGPAPPFQMYQAHGLPKKPQQAQSEDLFGPASAPGQQSQRNAYENLFGSPEKASTSAEESTTLSQHSSLSSSQGPTGSFSRSLPPPVQPRQNQQFVPYQQQPQQLPSSRPFGQAPPPAAPFLGYADNTRSQSFRTPAAPASTPASLFPDSRKIPSPVRSPPTASTPLPSPPRITLEAPSPDDLVDDFLKMPVDERFAGAEHASPPASKLFLADIPDTIEGLEALYAQKRWKSLTKKSLSMLQNPSIDVNVTLEIKSWWLAGLIKEGHYDNAASVLDQIGNLDELSATVGKAPFVPIRLFLLQALLSKCQGKLLNHEKQLFHLMMRLRTAIGQNETVGVNLKEAAQWLRIAQFALANHLVQQQKFMLALRICSQIDAQYLEGREKVVVLSRVGRIRLQMGDLTAAEKLFDAARYHTGQLRAVGSNETAITTKDLGELEARLLLNDGLLLFAQNKLQEALSAFDSILYLQNAQGLTPEASDTYLFLEEDVVCSAVNNYAICALYCCDVKAAVAALERMIRSNPQRFLNGVVVFNLSSLYDLLFDNATSKSRKEMMKKIAHLYDLEHVDPAAYRI
ncbi:unnamed protein product [Phytophthora fragariaefolia]|uniref:Unnamed protein product n=1 Tax=Phytophthora fragariaefolia TaxID=1490495 RepID=A0A9W6TRA9_9STRA|nr:unnamed protein product [Phytophthora fragariaefolia]